MGKSTVIPFGPQHPVLPEPIHLDLELQDEKVVRAIPSIGYVHRGLEKLVEKRGFQEYVYVAERVCGICSFGHGWGYSKAVEGLMGIEVPKRAEYLRTIWHELSRLHSHLLWVGLGADGMGFESLFMHAWRLREIILDIFESTTGGRVIFSACKVGGVRRDIADSELKEIVARLDKLKKEIDAMIYIILGDETIHARLRRVGVVTLEDAIALGCVGPTARASGLPLDYRCGDEGGAYKDLGFRPITETEGDCFARCKVRLRELLQSIDIIKGCVENMPAGDIAVPVKGFPPAAEHFTRVEQPRGEALYYVKGNKTKNLERFRLRTPTNVNIPVLVKMLQGCDLADVPNIILTIDPCISCCER
ncbi:MAG: nickel-dependent hydrogenase large subunit [Acidaminococcaceae bacterium]|nr:nickel-dependent hydrogenase large subunit [Acidaminococcaceae bacterium]MBQ9697820.1 nickel-dependent hydrogenase large subunit [Acidaminococcaceae bacterium]